MSVALELVTVEKPTEVNLILGHSHFIKTVEDLYEAVVSSVPGIEFGLAFCEASQERLVRVDGTHDGMKALAKDAALAIGAGHTFVIFLNNAFPINVLNAVKACPEVCRIYCATANPLQVVVAKTGQGRGILGVIDGFTPLGVEDETAVAARLDLLKAIGYKR